MPEPDDTPFELDAETRRQLAGSLRMFAEMGRQAGESIRAVSSALRYQPVIPPVDPAIGRSAAELGRGLTEFSARLNEVLAPTLETLERYQPVIPPVAFRIDPAIGRSAAELGRGLTEFSARLNEVLAPTLERLEMMTRAVADAMAQTDFATIAEFLARALPPNWGRLSDLQWTKLPEVAFDDGIPIAWVPRRELLTRLLAAADRAERIQLLIDHESMILADCTARLEECTELSLADDATLAKQAVRAYQDGHPEAAQSHAVQVAYGLITTIVEEYEPGGNTNRVARELAAQFDLEVSLAYLRRLATLAPADAFLRKCYPQHGDPVPEALNRHVHGHRPWLRHYRKDNALLALMLMTSLLRERQAQLAPRAGHHEEPAA